jgi:four helix bundle suffix protein
MSSEKQYIELYTTAREMICKHAAEPLNAIRDKAFEDFKKQGGVRERMHAARTAARAENWDKSIYSRLDSAPDAAQLALMAEEIKRKVDQTVWSIRKRKGWQ